MQVFYQLIHVDFVPIVTIFYLIIFMRSNDAFEHKINQRFYLSLGLLILLMIIDNIDYYCSGLAEPILLRKLAIMGGYITRVVLLMSAVLILKRNSLTRRGFILLVSPAALNALIVCAAFFTDSIFWLDAQNVLHREPLSFTPHILSLLYFFVVLGIAVRRYQQGYRDEGLMLFISLGSVLIGVVGEIVFKTRGLLIAAIALMLTFYYLYLHMEHFKRDNLTGALNRMTFFADLQRLKNEKITAFCEFDLNNLKTINDTEGHAAGDKAIVATAQTILHCLPHKSFLYRLGGDEFGVLFCSTRFETVTHVIDRIQTEFTKTPYTCAIGAAAWETEKSFTEIYNLADKRMYIDKERLKKLQKGDIHA